MQIKNPRWVRRASLGLTVGLLMTCPHVVADEADLQAEARQLVAPFAQQLQSTVKQAMQTGGPVAAIEACQLLAPDITSQHSQPPWTVARTALKVRNPDNAPDDWEKKVLADFEAELAAGKSIDKLSHSEIINGEFRYMQAIGMGEACTACHGQDIKPEVKTVIDQKYPYDEATGFTVGDLRGAFSLRRAVQ